MDNNPFSNANVCMEFSLSLSLCVNMRALAGEREEGEEETGRPSPPPLAACSLSPLCLFEAKGLLLLSEFY